MKHELMLFVLIVSTFGFAQTEYKTTHGITYKVGDTLQIGQPMGISLSVGHWKTIFMKNGREIRNDNLIDKKVIISKIEYFEGITRFMFRINSTNFFVNIDEAIAKGEIINPYKNAVQTSKESNKYDNLRKVKELYNLGAITKDEYEIEKTKILNLPN